MKFDSKWVENQLAGMSVEEKVGQTLMVAFFAVNDDTADDITKIINKYNLGGIFHFSATQKVLASALKKIQSSVKHPVLVGTDYECGPGWVIEDGLRTPRAMVRGHRCDVELEYELGKLIALQGRSMGSILTFSPVIDLNTHHANPDVNIRAYGEDAETISKLTVPYVKGLQENGMLAGVKHFPGNGATDMDQHIVCAINPCSKEEMYENFLEPYRRAFAEGDAAAIMIAHLEIPSLVTEINPRNGRLVPASLSKEIVTDLLKKEMGFKGLAVTDALNMGGVLSHYTRPELAVKAIQAGIDHLLIFNPESFEIEYNAILAAVKSGEISMERLDDAVRNVLIAKSKAGIDTDKGLPASDEVRDELFRAGKYDDLCIDIIQKGITVLRNNNDVLPIKDIKGKKVAVISTFNPDADTYNAQRQGNLTMVDRTSELLRQKGAIVEEYEMFLHMETGKIHEVLNAAKQCDYIFYNFFIAPSWGIGSLMPNKSALRLFMFGLLTVDKPLVITAFGDPYVMYYCPNAPVYMCTYDETYQAQVAAVKAWLGEKPVNGRTPVSLDKMFKKGDGIDI